MDEDFTRVELSKMNSIFIASRLHNYIYALILEPRHSIQVPAVPNGAVSGHGDGKEDQEIEPGTGEFSGFLLGGGRVSCRG